MNVLCFLTHRVIISKWYKSQYTQMLTFHCRFSYFIPFFLKITQHKLSYRNANDFHTRTLYISLWIKYYEFTEPFCILKKNKKGSCNLCFFSHYLDNPWGHCQCPGILTLIVDRGKYISCILSLQKMHCLNPDKTSRKLHKLRSDYMISFDTYIAKVLIWLYK